MFRITLRDISELPAAEGLAGGGAGGGITLCGGGGAGIEEAVEALRKSGFVNYFGLQVLVYEVLSY